MFPKLLRQHKNLRYLFLAKVQARSRQKNLKVMDASAIALARDNNLPIIVFSLDEPGGFRGILAGDGTYTMVHGGSSKFGAGEAA